MNNQEFYAKVQQSSAQKQAAGQTITMQANESSEDFINRLLSM